MYDKELEMGDVLLLSIYEQRFTHFGAYDNPYVALSPVANITGPDREERRVSLLEKGLVWHLMVN